MSIIKLISQIIDYLILFKSKKLNILKLQINIVLSYTKRCVEYLIYVLSTNCANFILNGLLFIVIEIIVVFLKLLVNWPENIFAKCSQEVSSWMVICNSIPASIF